MRINIEKIKGKEKVNERIQRGLWTCCICESETEVRNIIQLDYKVKSESGWGCFQCGLPAEVTVAIVCDTCIEKYVSNDIEDLIRFLMDGRERRIPVPPIEGRILHEHDMSHHPEFNRI